MYLRKIIRSISFLLFFCLFAWYAGRFFGEVGEDILIHTWSLGFHRLNASCIFWITLRMAAWIGIYLRLLHLESGFYIYLFLRQRSFGRVFVRIYTRCVGMALCYFGLGTLIMAVYHSVVIPGLDWSNLLRQDHLLQILAEECLGCLSFGLTSYMVHCVIRKAEIGFLMVLAGRLLLSFAAGEGRIGLFWQMVVHVAVTGITFFAAFRDFAEKIGDI